MPSLTPDLIEDAARLDPDRTLATSFLGPVERARVIALILFASEIARARAAVSEPGLAAIRLQWWRDVVGQIYAGARVHAQPIAVALAHSVQEANLPRTLLDGMIDGHEQELEAAPFGTWDDVETYLDQTHGNLARLSFLACGVKAISTPINEAARAGAIAWGISRLIGATPQWCMRRSTWLPKVIRDQLALEDVYAGNVSAHLVTALGDARNRARAAQKAANKALSQATLGEAFPVLAHVCLGNTYCRAHTPSAAHGWARQREISLLERQTRMTLSVARGRV
jgi:phytoene/squalene synthetase